MTVINAERNAGKETTQEALDAAFDFAERHAIKTIVVASTRGTTGLEAAKRGKAAGMQVVVVTHNVGFRFPFEKEIDDDTLIEIESLGARVHTGTMVLRGIGAALRKKMGTSEEELVANVLRMFGQGMKVCVEMAAMVSDAGLVPEADIVCIAGTARGADTAVLIHPAPSNRFFDIKIREIIFKPNVF